jgi:hypothetical protein
MTDRPPSSRVRTGCKSSTRTRAIISAGSIDIDFTSSTSTSQKFFRKRLCMAVRSASLASGKTFASCSRITR